MTHHTWTISDDHSGVWHDHICLGVFGRTASQVLAQATERVKLAAEYYRPLDTPGPCTVVVTVTVRSSKGAIAKGDVTLSLPENAK